MTSGSTLRRRCALSGAWRMLAHASSAMSLPLLATGLLLFIYCGDCRSQTKSPPLTGKELLQKAIDARLKITSGEFVFTVKFTNNGRGKSVVFRQTVHTWFDHEQLRGDTLGAQGKQINCFGCYGKGSLVTYSTQAVPHGKMAVTVQDEGDAILTEKVVDPRWVGLMPLSFGMAIHFHIETIYAVQKSSPATVTEVMMAGSPCLLVKWRPAYPPVEIWAWIDPGKDYSVVRVESHWKNYGVDIIETVRTRHKFFGAAGIWFPEEVVFEARAGDKVTSHETLSIEVKSLNQPIDAKIFSLAGIAEIKPDTPINWTSEKLSRPEAKGREMVWDGKSIVAADGDTDLEKAGSNGSLVRLLIFANIALVLLAVLIFFGYKRFRRRGGPDRSEAELRSASEVE